MADLTLELPDYRSDELARTVRRLYDHAGALTEQLRYVLMHLDEENIPALGGLQEELRDAAGNISSLQQSAAALLARVESAEGDLSTLALTAQGLATRVESAEGSLSTLTQTANVLSVWVSNANGDLSTLTQTANGLTLRVSNVEGQYSQLKQTVDGFDFTGMVTFNDLDGYATEYDLRRGNTTISGACITTGEIDCEYIQLYGELQIYDELDGATGGYIGYITGTGVDADGDEYETYGIGMKTNSSGSRGIAMCTSGGARIGYGDYTALACTKSNIYASQAISVGSDRRLKNTITYDLQENYEAMYRALKPCRFKLNDGQSDRFHTGFVAQEIEEAVVNNGLRSTDLAAYCINDAGKYTVRYSELIALNTAFVQQLLARVDALEERVRELEQN